VDRRQSGVRRADLVALEARLRHQGPVRLGRALFSYLRWLAHGVECLGLSELTALPTGGPRVFYCYRNQDIIALVLTFCLPEAEDKFRNLQFVVDDSIGGRLSTGLIRELGHEILWLRRSSLGQRARDVQELIRSNQPIGIAVDTRGPYGRVQPSLPRLAARCGVPLVPVVARLSRAFPIWRRPWMGVPLPGTLLSFAVGDPVRGDDSPEGVLRLQASLERADERAREKLSQRESSERGR
jgi:lysophospholipid acyltransferase (LPLAT)-like uncharacterized protein